MGSWKPPEKVTLPSEFEDSAAQGQAPNLFEYNGHLPDGTQLLAYLITLPPNGEKRRDHLAAVHEFDADGHHRFVRTERGAENRPDPWELLEGLIAPHRAAGWKPGPIRVRPFMVHLDGVRHGLEFDDRGGDAEEEGVVFFYPFWFPFHPPFTEGSYDT